MQEHKSKQNCKDRLGAFSFLLHQPERARTCERCLGRVRLNAFKCLTLCLVYFLQANPGGVWGGATMCPAPLDENNQKAGCEIQVETYYFIILLFFSLFLRRCEVCTFPTQVRTLPREVTLSIVDTATQTRVERMKWPQLD